MGQARHTDGMAARARLAIGRVEAMRMFGAIMVAVFFVGMPASADRNGVAESSRASGPKAYWQDRYRTLLSNAEKLRAEIDRETELYADANRRNYRRGDERHRHRIKAQEARERLSEVEAELATIKDDGRRAGALPGWFNEVEIEVAEPASPADVEQGPGDAGRNPLYVDDKD